MKAKNDRREKIQWQEMIRKNALLDEIFFIAINLNNLINKMHMKLASTFNDTYVCRFFFSLPLHSYSFYSDHHIESNSIVLLSFQLNIPIGLWNHLQTSHAILDNNSPSHLYLKNRKE